jgi:hypothetical protein
MKALKIYVPVVIRFATNAAEDDPQKLLLPGLVLTIIEDEDTKAEDVLIGILQFGWWHWSFDIYFAFAKL